MKLEIGSIFYYYTLFMVCLFTFINGYFPSKKLNSTSQIKPPLDIKGYPFNNLYEPKFHKLVFIVIDALRTDFLTEKLMPYLYSESSNTNCLFELKVEAPTVTLPRIKALTTGVVPQFLDIVTNLANPEPLKNSFLHSAKLAGKKLIFYGDDTWLKIYPDIFSRSEGTNSLFVNDFYEVDNNVTRNVNIELTKHDWDFMFLHYLGLDHIGHVEGPFSEKVPLKLAEMDEIVKNINKHSQDNTLVIITGDHGMKDSGGHGGMTYAETHVPLAILGSKCTSNRELLLQTDIPVTLSALFGLEIPAQSIGTFIKHFQKDISIEQLLYYYYYNLLIISQDQQTNDDIKAVFDLHYNYLTSKHSNISRQDLLKTYEKSLTTLSNKLGETSIEQHVHLLIILLISQFAILFRIIILLVSNEDKTFVTKNELLSGISLLATILLQHLKVVSILLFVIFIIILLLDVLRVVKLGNFKCPSNIVLPFILFSIYILLLMCSTSYIEEEHQIWYYYLGTSLVVLQYKNSLTMFKSVILISCFIFIRKLNQTGDQFASLPDLIDWFVINEHYHMYLLYILISLGIIVYSLRKIVDNNKICFYLNTFLAINIIVFKLFCSGSLYYAQLLWCGIILLTIINIVTKVKVLDSFIISWIFLNLLICRLPNISLIPFTIFMSRYFHSTITNDNTLTILHICLGNALHFCQGHSNSLASIDVAVGYVGISSYDPVLVASLVICNVYCYPILSMLLLVRSRNGKNIHYWNVYIVYRMVIMTCICVITFIQRYHLFVWSVFAPKLLIETCHSILLFVQIIVYNIIKLIKKIT